MTDRLKADGLFDEIVSWKLRLFAPSMRPAPAFWRSSWSAIRSCASPSGRLREASTSAPWRWRALSASSSQPRKRSHRTAWLTKRVLAFGDADRSHRLRLRPDCGHGLDLRKAHSAAFFQVQKAHQAQLIIGAFPQGRSSGACLPEMNEISLPLLDKWRCSISLSGSGKEDFFKHDRVSISMETRSCRQLAVGTLC